MGLVSKQNVKKVNVNVHIGLYERIKDMAETTGQTYSSVMQMALAIGVGQLEPAVMGSIKQNSDANAEVVSILQKVLPMLEELEELVEEKKQESEDKKQGFHQEELKLDGEKEE